MKMVLIDRPGGYRHLRLESAPDPPPGPGELLIGVQASGVNFADCLTRMGYYSSARHYRGYPLTPGFEVAGRVLALGPGVSGHAVGDPVLALTLFNGYASRLVARPGYVFPLPEGWTPLQGAGFPTVFLTAWFALFELAHPHPGDCLLVHSAAGGVGSALVQLGRLAGCRVVGVVGSSHKVDAVRHLGADAVIDKSRESLWMAAERLAPEGYQVVLDANGPSTLAQSYRHLAPAGKLVVYGFHDMFPRSRGVPNRVRLWLDYVRTPRFNPFQLTNRNRSVMGFNLSYLFDRTDLLATAMGQLLGWVAEGRVQPLPVTGYPLEQVAEAHRALESGMTVGKLVLTMEEPA
jgi:NADPH:quinone reductase-like Zn-dependent oxidoreductase